MAYMVCSASWKDLLVLIRCELLSCRADVSEYISQYEFTIEFFGLFGMEVAALWAPGCPKELHRCSNELK